MVERSYRPDGGALMGRILMAAAVAVTAAGCTYVAPEGLSGNATTAVPGSSTPQAAPTSVAGTWGSPLSGRFISQGARTDGVVRIAGTGAGVTLTLEGISTTPSPDLKLMLNEGALSKNASGDMVVEDPKFLDIGAKVKPGPGSQTFELPPSPPFIIRSVTIVDLKTRVAYGTAELSPGSASG